MSKVNKRKEARKLEDAARLIEKGLHGQPKREMERALMDLATECGEDEEFLKKLATKLSMTPIGLLFKIEEFITRSRSLPWI